MTKIRNIGVLTSGGDAPGMNACIRSITRIGIANGYGIFGIADGYNGMIDNNIQRLEYNDVSNIIQKGGTILGTARSERFFEKSFREKAFKNLKALQIDLLIVIGGDGSFKGAKLFNSEWKISFIGIPATIDNDIFGTEYTIGFDTALNNIVKMVDNIRDTASSHHRIFLVEVMGNNSGLLAVNSALVTGAEEVFIPETKEDFIRFEQKIRLAIAVKKSSIIIVAEGDEIGGAKELLQYLEKKQLHEKIRIAVLGHTQRGGSPTFIDRQLATKFGIHAIQNINTSNVNCIVGLRNNAVHSFQLGSKITKDNQIDNDLLDRIHDLSIF